MASVSSISQRPRLPRKRLGKTGVEVTTVGIGTAWIGLKTLTDGTSDRYLDEDLAVSTLHAALEAGVELIDTAALYINSRAELLVARALRERPDLAAGVIVETKCCHLPDHSDFSYDGVMRSVEGSLQRLDVQRIELLYLHDPPKEVFAQVMGPAGAIEALRKLQSDGVAGHIGVASNNPWDNAPYVESGEFEMAVVPDAYSLLSQVALERIFPAAQRFGMGVVVATPLERGILATGVAKLGEHHARHFPPEVLAQVDQMEAICAEFGVSLLAAALQFVTRHPVVATTIPGARSPEEARQNALAGAEPIPEALWQAIEPLVKTWEIVVPG
jgi:D-threo-aldose 1-dehydrogenase